VSQRPTIVLVHGLAILREAPGMFTGLEAALVARAFEVRRTLVQGDGTLPELADRLWSQLEKIDGPLALLCHSMGGLEARTFLLDDARARRLAAIATLGSPHAGTPLVVPMTPVYRAYRDMTPAARARWEQAHGAAERAGAERHGVRLVSAIAALRRPATHMRLRATQRWLANRGPSDGLVPADSQRFGEVLFEADLDHVECSLPPGLARPEPAFDAWVRLAEAAADAGPDARASARG
jgi:triacylglycerol lipase